MRGERMLALQYFLISILALAIIIIPAGFFMLRRFEASATFHPERAAYSGSWRAPRGGEDVWFKTADGLKLNGWFFRSTKEVSDGTVVYFHGNGGNLSYCDWVGVNLAERGFDVLLFDYRGYGRSEGEPEGEQTLYMDADAALDFVLKDRGARPDRIVLYGQSLGTAAAIDAASRRGCGALIVESGLSSARDMAGAVMPWLPGFLRGMTKNKFDSVRKIPLVRCPVLVVHGARDDLIPSWQGHKLFEAAPEPKQWKLINGAGHNDLSIIGGKQYIDSLADFINGSLHFQR